MAKMIRCPAGHVYDKAEHASCPQCARMDVQDADEAQAQEQIGEPRESERPVAPETVAKEKKEPRHLPPLVWIAGGGGAAALALIAGAAFLLRSSPPTAPEPTKVAHFGAAAPASSRLRSASIFFLSSSNGVERPRLLVVGDREIAIIYFAMATSIAI